MVYYQSKIIKKLVKFTGDFEHDFGLNCLPNLKTSARRWVRMYLYEIKDLLLPLADEYI
jgi:hypothetical protein